MPYNATLPGGGKLSLSQQPQKVIIITMTGLVLVAIVETVHSNQSGPVAQKVARILIGGFIAGALLLALSYIVPEFAAGLALIALAATLLDRGKPFWDVLSNVSTNTTGINVQAAQALASGVQGVPAGPQTPIPSAYAAGIASAKKDTGQF